MSWITELSDFFTTHWPEILAILTSSTVIPTLVSGLFKTIATRSQNKHIKGLLEKVDDKFKFIESKLTEVEGRFNSISEDAVEQFTAALKTFADEYSRAKKQLCEKIVAGREQVQEVLEEVDKVIAGLEVKIEEVEQQVETPIIQEETPVIEEVAEETPKTTAKVAKRVIIEE